MKQILPNSPTHLTNNTATPGCVCLEDARRKGAGPGEARDENEKQKGDIFASPARGCNTLRVAS